MTTTLDGPSRVDALLALGEARFHFGDFAAASEALNEAIETGRNGMTLTQLETACELLAMSWLPQGKYDLVVQMSERLHRDGPLELALMAEFLLGIGISLQSATPQAAIDHLDQAEQLLKDRQGLASRVTLSKLRYHMSNARGQMGDLQQAIALAKEALALMQQDDEALDLQRSILVYNNIAYYLSLIHDPAAADYARAGLQRAKEKGTLSHQPYLLSTLGEIAMDQNDLHSAEHSFQEGLELAVRLNMPERIAGLTMNLGIVAAQRGEIGPAVARLREARQLADQLGNRHLAARVRIALAPLLPTDEARQLLQEARTMAEQGDFTQLIAKINALAPSA